LAPGRKNKPALRGRRLAWAAIVAAASWSSFACNGAGHRREAVDEKSSATDPAQAGAPPTFAGELARAGEVGQAQARFREELGTKASEAAAAREARQTRIHGLAGAAREASPDGAATDALLERIMVELRGLRPEVESAFRVAVPPAAPRFTPRISEIAAAGGKPEPEAIEVGARAEALKEAADALDGEAQAAASERLAEVIDDEQELDGARLLLLARLSEPRRDEVLGVDREGIEQLRGEIWHIGARARWYGLRRDGLRRDVLATLREPSLLISLLLRGGAVLLAIAAAVYVHRRRTQAIAAIAAAASRLARRPRILRGIERVREVVAGCSAALTLLLAIWGIHWALGSVVSRNPELEIVYSLLLWYGLYRLALAATHGWIVRRAGGPASAAGDAAPASAAGNAAPAAAAGNAAPAAATGNAAPAAAAGNAKSRRILRSLELVGRYALGVRAVLILSKAIGGEGYIYDVVGRFAWLGAIPLGWVLIRWWRSDIADAYLRLHDEGNLADAVRSSRSRWYGFFVALAAFSAIVLAAGGRAARRFVLGFDQSQRVLAFIFRRRLEKQSKGSPAAEAASELPDELRAHFSEEPGGDPADEIDYHPGLDQFEASFAAWKANRCVGAALVMGAVGAGKTMWLAAAERKAEGILSFPVVLEQRILTAEALVSTFATGLGAPAEAHAGVTALAAWLRSGPRRLLVIDDLEHLFLRGVDTWDAWDAFVELIEHSGHSIFWLCAIAQQPYRYLRFTRGSADVFRLTVTLPSWPEQKLTELLRKRTEASGYGVSYDGIAARDEDEDEPERAAGSPAVEREFMRLLWDYALGSPRVAMYFWLQSLVEQGERSLRVRLFQGPDQNQLEALSEPERFVLACVVWHDSLTIEEAARSLGYQELICEDALAKLTEIGVLAGHDGRHLITTRWHRVVTSYLLRKHLIQP
jgi:hypothetical protein